MATTLAGQMSNAAQPNAQWLTCDGKPYYVLDPKQTANRTVTGVPIAEGNRQDYLRRVGWQGRRRGLGPLGWIICMPVASGYKVSTADDSSESNLVPNVTTTTTAAASAAATVIAVTSATGFVVGLPIAATGLATGTTIAGIASLNITLSTPVLAGGVASGATVTVTPAPPPSVAKPPAGTQ